MIVLMFSHNQSNDCMKGGGKEMRIDYVKLVTEMAKQRINVIGLAQKAGLSRNTISAIKCGKSCSVETCQKIAKALNVTINELCT